MGVHIALLHGVNVAGRKLAMSELRAACARAGCTQARTLLASGNVVVRSRLAGAALEKKLEAALADETGLATRFYVRTPNELAGAIKSNPFATMAKQDPSHLLLYFLKAKPSAAEVGKALAPQPGPEEIAVKGMTAYVTYPSRIGVSKFKMRLIGTGRNWNTVQKIAALAAEMEA